MEALQKLEQKWKLTQQEAVLLFVCTLVAVIGLCSAAIFKTMRRKKKPQAPKLVHQETISHSESTASSGDGLTRKLLKDYMRWSERSNWDGLEGGSWQLDTPPLLLGSSGSEVELGWTSHSSSSPVWQRPILMGERCELPRFSGLILYDERGKPLLESTASVTCLESLLASTKP